jgi:hypothetical protein
MPLKLCTYNKHKACETGHRLYLFLLVAALTCCNNAVSYGQTRFNENYPFGTTLNQGTNVLELTNGYLVFEQIDDYDSLNTRIGIRKIDLLGNENWIKYIYRPKTLLYAGLSNSVQYITNNLILISGTFIDTLNYEHRAQGSILAINENGDSLWQKTYGSQWKDGFYSSFIDSDYNLVSVGYYRISATNYNAWALKTDTLGNVIWDKKFGGINGDLLYSVLQAPDGGYYLAGASNSFAGINNSDIYLVKLDIDGNLIWQKNIANTAKNDGATGMVISNNKIYLTGVAKQTIGNGLLVITDLDGNVLRWQEFGSGNLNEEFMTKPISLSNGDIVVGGFKRTQQNPNVPWGWLFKFNQDGDSIWSRTYFNNPNAPNYIYDLKATSDGGFIMAGSTNDSLGGIGAQNSWVLKVDEYGCEIENCQLYDAVEDVAVNNIYFSASPNPFSNQTTLNYTLAENTKAELMVVEMSTGKIIKRVSVIADASQSYLLNNEGLTPGVYAIQLFINSQLINAIKVVYMQ